VSAQFFSAAQPERPEAGPAGEPQVSRWPLWSLALVCLAVMSFGSFLAEGVVTDWSAVYLHSSLAAPVGLAAVGYTVFSCTMTGGRMAGDRLADLVGPARLVRLSAGLAAVGFGLALSSARCGPG
jgi:MFS family permease